MEPMYLSIRQKETGSRIKRLLAENGYSVRDVQNVMGFENPQAIYKWISGKTLPSLDNLVILSRILNISMEDILVVNDNGDVVVFGKNNGKLILFPLHRFLKNVKYLQVSNNSSEV